MSTRIFQLKLDQSIVNCGMSYVIKLNSGDFFIIDGGYFTPNEDKRLYDFLCKQSDGSPHIKGWMFTHAHQDHIGCFMEFIEHYHNDVTIDTLYYNFQPTRHKFALGSWKKKSNDLATIKQFYKIIKKHNHLFNIHTLKTNEAIMIDELCLDVLYTQENLYPKKASFNDYSSVVMISTNNTRLLILGDVQAEGSQYLLENKMDKLKADIVQVSHHGFNGATKELYKAISPKIALFPTPDYEFERISKNEVNSYILNEIGIEKYYVSGYSTTELEL